MPVVVFRVLASLLALVVCCRAHHRPSNSLLEEQIRWGKAEDIPLFSSGEDLASMDRNRLDSSRYFEDNSDASISSDELLDGPGMVSKRREGGMGQGGSRGPTLSVVSPLEVLRQRLRLDRAKQLFRENQRQIVANEALLEKIGKRAAIDAP